MYGLQARWSALCTNAVRYLEKFPGQQSAADICTREFEKHCTQQLKAVFLSLGATTENSACVGGKPSLQYEAHGARLRLHAGIAAMIWLMCNQMRCSYA